MGQTLTRAALPLYFIAYFGLCFVWRSVVVWRRTGVNPLVLGTSDSVYDYVGRCFKLTIGMAALSVVLHALGQDDYLAPIFYMELDALKTLGGALLLVSLLWTYIAQRQMSHSWRIGIDLTHKTELVRRGLFLRSRNPIFVGMIATIFGLFLVIPNAITLLVLVLGVVLIQIQVRLEEEFLLKTHGEVYAKYCHEVRRWI